MFDPERPPEFQISRWLNTKEPLSLAKLKGKVVMAVAFQMLCPGCVEHGLPQAKRLRERFNPNQVAIIGLHTVFEHHAVMTPAALDVFMYEYKWPFPVGIDEADADGVPKTMAAYQMQGTPTLLIFDRAGRLRRHYFGRPDDILVAAELMALSIEAADAPREQATMIERRLSETLVMPGDKPAHDHGRHEPTHHDHHDHGDGCGCDHDHSHDHGHHDHPHGHEVEAAIAKAAAAARAKPAAVADAKAGKPKTKSK
jgi:AhpC/TSA family